MIEALTIDENANFIVDTFQTSEALNVVPIEARYVEEALIALIYIPDCEKYAIMQLGTNVGDPNCTYRLIHNLERLCTLQAIKIKVVNERDEVVEEYISCLFNGSKFYNSYIPDKEAAKSVFITAEFEA